MKSTSMTSEEYRQMVNGNKSAGRKKYSNKIVKAYGKRFDSKKEYNRFLYLKDQENSNEISELKHQVAFELKVENEIVGKYIADFTYKRNGLLIVEDVKGGEATKTPMYRWKKKHLEAQYGIKISEV